MTTRKSGLLGLMLGVMVLAACEGDPPLPPPEITVDIVPDTATLSPTAPGNTRQFTALVQGSANQAVTWSSSVQAVATVNGNGLVTAVAVGSTQIIAKSVADPTKSAAAVVSVGSGPQVTISIASVNQGGTNVPVTTGNVRGQIDVTADLQRPNGAAVSKVEFLVDGALLDGNGGRPSCTVTFTSGGSADLEVAEAAEPITCSINTAGFVEATGVPAFVNGNHTITARAVLPSGGPVSANSQQLTFNNPNFINATVTFVPATGRPACVTAGANAGSIGGPGSLWCGGDVRVNVIQVNYGAATQALASATVALRTVGNGVSWEDGVCRTANALGSNPTVAQDDGGTGPGSGSLGEAAPGCPTVTKTLTDSNAADGLSVTFSSTSETAATGILGIEDEIKFRVSSVTVGGQAGPVCINPIAPQNPIGDCGNGGNFSPANELFSVNKFLLDNLAPRTTLFDLTPTACGTAANCYVNGSFTFATRSGFYASVDYGVNHQSAATFFQAGAAATSLATAASASTLDNTATSAELLLRVSARDSLGNVATRYPTATATTITTAAGSALRFGVDKVAPFATGVDAPDNNGAGGFVANSFNVTAADTSTQPAGPSGINTANDASGAVIVRIERINATNTRCKALDGSEIDCEDEGNQGDGTEAVGSGFGFPSAVSTDNGYYRVTYRVRDRAGNLSAPAVVMQLRDPTAPGSGAVVGPSVIQGNASAAFSAAVTDNLDLGDVASYIEYNGVPAPATFIQDVAAPAGIGTYGPDSFTTSGSASSTLPNFMRSIQTALTGPDTLAKRAISVSFNVRDAAGVANDDVCPHPDSTAVTLGNCRRSRDNIAAAVNAGITGSLAQVAYKNFTSFSTGAPSEPTVCNGSAGEPCDNQSETSTTLTASAVGPSATFNNPFTARVNFYYSGPATNGRAVLIGAGTPLSTQDNGNTRTFRWSINWTPAGLAVGAYQVFAIGVDTRGQGLWLLDTQTVQVNDD
jgi:Big-like domain-containing protein